MIVMLYPLSYGTLALSAGIEPAQALFRRQALFPLSYESKQNKLEARAGIKPAYELLQSPASSLRHLAVFGSPCRDRAGDLRVQSAALCH